MVSSCSLIGLPPFHLLRVGRWGSLKGMKIRLELSGGVKDFCWLFRALIREKKPNRWGFVISEPSWEVEDRGTNIFLSTLAK